MATRRRLLTIPLLLLVPALIRSPAQDYPGSYRLKTVEYFAFGGIGYAAGISQGELDYRSILVEPPDRALTVLEMLYVKGNPQAKAYALVGIHKLSPARFSELYAGLSSSTEKVSVMEGCVGSTRMLKDVAADIDMGKFH